MNLNDALFNWLQITIVSEARSDDHAAKETMDFFEQILREDHLLTSFYIDKQDDNMYVIHYEWEGQNKVQKFDRESADRLLTDINSNPIYNNSDWQ
ncbi:hypothetical protein D3C73_748800 [compost metagenome]